MIIQDTLHELKSSAQCGDRSLALQVLLLLCCLSKCHKSCLELFLFFPEDTSLRYRYETKYRTATVMEEDALNQPTAAGETQSLHHTQLSALHVSL